MNTELILYSQQLFENPRFTNVQSFYGWDISGTWTKSTGKITKSTGSLGSIRQDDILVTGARYRIRFTITDRSAGNCFVMNKAGGTVHQTVSSNADFDVEFTADADDLIFDCSTTFNGAIQNASIVAIPEQFNLELTGDESIPFTFNIDDIFDISKRKTAWTKTVKIPFTAYNNKAFGHVYKINSEGVFDPRIKARVLLRAKGLQLHDLTLCLDSITKFEGGGFYNVSMFGNTFDIFSRLGERTIKDLDFSAYDHAFTLQILRYNWGGIGNGFVTTDNPSVCFNSPTVPNLNLGIDSLGQNDVTGISSVSFASINRVKITFLTNHGFSVGDELHIITDNNLLGGTQIVADVPAANEITLWMGWDNLTDTSTPSASTLIVKRVWRGIGYWYPLQDNGTYQRLLTQSEGTLIQGRLYRVTQDDLGTDDFSNLATDPFTGAPVSAAEGTTFKADDGVSAAGAAITPTVWVGRTELITHEWPENDGVLESKERSINHWYAQDLIPHIFINEVWDKMIELIGYEVDCEIADSDLFKRLVMPMDQRFNVIENNGEVVHMNDWLPGMRLVDFFVSILNMFNLVILEDKENRNKITLVSRNTFYDNGTEKSWEMHQGESLTIKLSNSLLPKYYQLKYANSTDFYNEQYKLDIGNINNENGVANDVNRTYGDYYLNTGNQFTDKTNIVEIKFSPTVMAGPLTQSPGGIYLDSDKTISVCYSADEDGTNLSRATINRILIAGFRGTDNAWSISSSDVTGSNELFDFQSGLNGRIFPYAAHIDNIYDGLAPYHDLNLGSLPGQYFPYGFHEGTWDQNTIVGKYWSRYLTVNRYAKHVSGTMKLNASQIYELDFRDEIRPLDCDFVLRLQKVIDWNINGNGLTKCEFLMK